MPFFPSTVVPRPCGHAVRAHSIDPPPVLDAGHLVFPVFLEHFYAPVGLGDIRLEMKVSPCVGGCHVRGSPLLPPGRSVPGGVGGNGALLSGPSAHGSGPFPEGVDRGETSRPPEVSIIRLRPWQAGAVGVPLRALGTWGLPLHRLVNIPEVPHQCPRMGLGVDEDGPPLS